MATLTLELPEETRRRLEDKAAQKGQPLETYLRGVLEAEAGRSEAGASSLNGRWARSLGIAAGAPSLPAWLSSAAVLV